MWRLVTLCLTRHHETSFSWQICAMRRPPVDDFCATTRHFASNSTSQEDFFKTTLSIDTSSMLTIFAQRLVILRLIWRHKTVFSWQICAMSRPLVDFCRTTRHFTSNSTTLRIDTSSTRLRVDNFCTSTCHFMSNSTSQDVFFKTTLHINTSSTRPHVDDSSLRLIRPHKTSYSRQLSASTRPRHVLLLTIFAGRLVTLRLTRRHKSSF